MEVLGEWIKQPASVKEGKLSLPFPIPPRDIEGRHRPFSPVVRKPLALLFFTRPLDSRGGEQQRNRHGL